MTSLLAIGLSAAVALAIQKLCLELPFGWLPLALAMSTRIAARGLYDHVAAVALGLEQGLPRGVRPSRISSGAIRRAWTRMASPGRRSNRPRRTSRTASSLPCSGAYCSLLGMAAQGKATIPGQHDRPPLAALRAFRRFAARLDDLATWLPARLSALRSSRRRCACPAGRPAPAGAPSRRDASRHRSVNAGWPEAAMAGALGLRLAGPRRYAGELVEDAWMGDGRPAANLADIRRGLRLLIFACGPRGRPPDPPGFVRGLTVKPLSSGRVRASRRDGRAFRDNRRAHRAWPRSAART